jgi:hypothetical protein
VADGQRKRSGPPAGTDPPSTPVRPSSVRRQFLLPANDNALKPIQRILRAVLFVVVGAGLAWLLRMALG